MFKKSKICRMCLSKKIKVGVKLAKMPLGERYSSTKKKALQAPKFPLSVGLCLNCKNIQTMEVVKPSLLWGDFTYLSSQTNFIIKHFKKFSYEVYKKFRLKRNEFIIDIGSNDGSLLEMFKNKGMKVLGIDPADTVVKLANRKKINTILGFFSSKLAVKINRNYPKAKIITCFNTFAHSEHIRDMIKGIKLILADDGVFIFECQYLRDIYKNKILGTFFHEHMYHHSATSLNNLFNSYNLSLFDIKRVNIQKGSIIGYVSFKRKYKISTAVKKILKSEKTNKDINFSKLKDFQKYIDKQKNNSIKILRKYKKSTIAGYGAARSGPTLAINFGIDKYIKFLFDDHPLKVNKFTPLNGLLVRPTKLLLKFKPKICVVLAYLHLKKIINKNVTFLKSGGKFLAIYPQPTIISYKNYKRFI